MAWPRASSRRTATVGYVELNYAAQTGLTSANVKNADGKFVAGSTAGVTAAAEAAAPTFPADFRQAPIINGPGADTYPIASYTYLLIPVEWKDADKAQAMVAFIYWALTDGQAEENALGLRAAARTDPGEGHRRAPQDHRQRGRRLALSLRSLPSSSDRSRSSVRDRSVVHVPGYADHATRPTSRITR